MAKAGVTELPVLEERVGGAFLKKLKLKKKTPGVGKPCAASRLYKVINEFPSAVTSSFARV